MSETAEQLMEQRVAVAGPAARSVYAGASAARLHQTIASAEQAKTDRRRFGGRMAALIHREADYVPELPDESDAT